MCEKSRLEDPQPQPQVISQVRPPWGLSPRLFQFLHNHPPDPITAQLLRSQLKTYSNMRRSGWKITSSSYERKMAFLTGLSARVV